LQIGAIIFFCWRERLREASRVKREAAKYASRDTNWSFEEVRCLIVKERNSFHDPEAGFGAKREDPASPRYKKSGLRRGKPSIIGSNLRD